MELKHATELKNSISLFICDQLFILLRIFSLSSKLFHILNYVGIRRISIAIYGVPVKRKELLGVLHLKLWLEQILVKMMGWLKSRLI